MVGKRSGESAAQSVLAAPAPVEANNDEFVANEGVATFINPLANDTYSGKGTLKITHVAGQPIAVGQTITLFYGSTVRLNADGTLTYRTGGANNNANLGETTDEGFTYTISDGVSSALGSIFITINGDYTRIDGTSAPDSLQGTAYDDLINGSQGSDVLYGNDGDDILNGGGGGALDVDQMFGGAGDDLYYVDSTRDGVTETADNGQDRVISSLLEYTLTANVEDLELGGGGVNGVGNELDNAILGNAVGNRLTGADGNDALDGAGGGDTLYGGAGGDALLGGAGADTFVYKAVADSQASVTPGAPSGAQALPVLGPGANTDVIHDFTVAQGDRIDLTAIDASTRAAGNNDFVVVAQLPGVAGQLTVKTFGGLSMTTQDGRLSAAPAYGYIMEGDVNGDGMADFTLLFNSPTQLTVNDLKAGVLGVSAWNISSIGGNAASPSAIQTTIPELFH